MDRGREKQTRFGLPAFAAVNIIVVADKDIVELNCLPNAPMDGLDHITALCTARDIGLIRSNDHEKTKILQFAARRSSTGHEDKVLDADWWSWNASAVDGALIERPVPIKEYRAPHLTDSHFVGIC